MKSRGGSAPPSRTHRREEAGRLGGEEAEPEILSLTAAPDCVHILQVESAGRNFVFTDT